MNIQLGFLVVRLPIFHTSTISLYLITKRRFFKFQNVF